MPLPATKPPSLVAAEAVTPPTLRTCCTWHDDTPARCSIGARLAIILAIFGAFFLPLLGMSVPFAALVIDSRDSVGVKFVRLDTHHKTLIRNLLDASIHQSYKSIVVNFELMIQSCIKKPAEDFVQDEWMQQYHTSHEGWGGVHSAQHRATLRQRTFKELVTRIPTSCHWGFDATTEWDNQTLWSSLSAQLLVGSSTGEYTSVGFHHHRGIAHVHMEDGEAKELGQPTRVRRWEVNAATGDALDMLQDTYSMPLTSKPWFSLQKRFEEQAHLDSHFSFTERLAWTDIYDSGPELGLGLAWTRPLTYCGDYSCFSGGLAFLVPLAFLDAACENRFVALRAMAYHQFGYDLGRDNASVFAVNRKSRNAMQQGLLLGASDGVLVGSSTLKPAEETEEDVVRSVASALKHKFGGSWDSPQLGEASHFFGFKRNHWASSGRLIDCDAWEWSSGAPEEGCQQVATVTVDLDYETSWLLVITLPAEVFVQKVAIIAKQVEIMTVQHQEVTAMVERAWCWTLLLGVLVFGFSSVLCFGLTWCVLRPMRPFVGLLQSLGDIDVANLSPELHRLRSGNLCIVKEVGDMQKAVCRTLRGIEAFARFAPEPIVRKIVRGESRAASLHVEKRLVTIMFSDICDFTTISEKLSHEDLLLVMSRYVSTMERIVKHYSGVLTEVLGDGLVVLWNTPEDVDNHAAMACMAALAQHRAVMLLNREFETRGLPQLSIRIGVNTGVVVTGNLGSVTKMRFGCLGDAVNLASRLEGLCKFYGVGIICSDATYHSLPEGRLICRKLDLVQVKGRNTPTSVYEVAGFRDDTQLILRAAPSSHSSLSSSIAEADPLAVGIATAEAFNGIHVYEKALLAFQKAQFVEAVQLLDDFLHKDPEDLAAQKLRERASRWLSADNKQVLGLSPEELTSWTGVNVMPDK